MHRDGHGEGVARIGCQGMFSGKWVWKRNSLSTAVVNFFLLLCADINHYGDDIAVEGKINVAVSSIDAVLSVVDSRCIGENVQRQFAVGIGLLEMQEDMSKLVHTRTTSTCQTSASQVWHACQ